MNVWVYLSSAGMSALGYSVAGIVWPWIVLERTGDPAAAGLVAAAVAVPSVLFAFLGGYLIDTVGRKPMSVISDIISGLSVAGVVLVDQTLGLTIAWFIILGIVGGVGDIPGMAARSALVGDIAQSSGKTVDYIAGLNRLFTI
ncbi:MFS transporter [Corynebacterium casei]|uniref:MFS transporter n=1 Tax=Corynebacterium casei TaxID=160386 RepID=UPI003FD03B36